MDTDISRRVRLTEAEIKILIGLTAGLDGAIIQGLHDRFVELSRENDDPSYRFMAQAYRDAVVPKDGELEMDDDAEVSMGDDPGAYVMVWTWVSDDDADIIHVSAEATEDDAEDDLDDDACRTCGETYEDGGDGYNGECPDCADKTYAKEFPDA